MNPSTIETQLQAEFARHRQAVSRILGEEVNIDESVTDVSLSSIGTIYFHNDTLDKPQGERHTSLKIPVGDNNFFRLSTRKANEIPDEITRYKPIFNYE